MRKGLLRSPYEPTARWGLLRNMLCFISITSFTEIVGDFVRKPSIFVILNSFYKKSIVDEVSKLHKKGHKFATCIVEIHVSKSQNNAEYMHIDAHTCTLTLLQQKKRIHTSVRTDR